MSFKLNSQMGRRLKMAAKTNLLKTFSDFPETPMPAPRSGPGEASLWVQHVDMCLQTNCSNHNTSTYGNQNLVVRRGLEFIMTVTFSRPLKDGDDFQVEFLIGSDPSATTNTYVVVAFGSGPGGQWSGRIVEVQDQTLTLGITPTSSAIVGRFRTYVVIVLPDGVVRTQRDTTTDLYLLFNAWNKDDAVFYPDEAGRSEYVLNDHGVIFQGTYDSMSQRSWDFGQFEPGILDACIYILDASKMPIADRGDVIKLTRVAAAMMNSQDDDGVLVGNWSNDYSLGTAPMSWTGSVSILLQYASTGVPVCFAQCWVYAGVFNTFLRCLGIPARVITNFVSAHDNNGSLETNLIYYSDGALDTVNTRDSIWNYHCWNEAFMARPDLPPGLAGWQVVDSTPQENSAGYYRCGPASVAAIKQGLLYHPFDLRFCFAEVNSVVISSTIDRYKKLTPFKVDNNLVGKALVTKAIGSTIAENITVTYKHPKGSPEDLKTMDRAHQYTSARAYPKLSASLLSISISANQVQLGQDVNLVVVFTNKGDDSTMLSAHLSGMVTFYTGVPSTTFKNQDFTVMVGAKQSQTVRFTIAAQEYLSNKGSLLSLNFSVSAQSDGRAVSSMKVVSLKPPKLNVTLSGQPRLKQQMFATVSFTNPLNFPLQNVTVNMEGSGLIARKSRSYSVIAPLSSLTWTESFVPQLTGLRHITASLDCSSLRGVTTFAAVNIKP